MANRKQFFIGFIMLLIGTMFYFIGRPEGSSYFQQKFAQIDRFFHYRPDLFGELGGSLPEFIHPFVFSLISMGLISKTKKSRFWVCFIFFCINVFFEIGQKYKDFIIKSIPTWFNKIPLLENTNNFFAKGIFSDTDIIAIFLGSVTAFIIAELTFKKEEITNAALAEIN